MPYDANGNWDPYGEYEDPESARKGERPAVGPYGGRVVDPYAAPTVPAPSADEPPPPDDGSGGVAIPEFSYPDFVPPSFDLPEFVMPAPFEYAPYEPLTAETFQADPGYDFRMKEGTRAMLNARSAEGLLRTGGTLKELMSYGQGLASQEFGNVDARNFRNWQAGRASAADIYDRNLSNDLLNWQRLFNTEAQEFNRDLLTYQTNFGKEATSAGINLGALGDAWGRMLSLYDLSTRSLPQYTPTVSGNPAAYGFAN